MKPEEMSQYLIEEHMKAEFDFGEIPLNKKVATQSAIISATMARDRAFEMAERIDSLFYEGLMTTEKNYWDCVLQILNEQP